MPRLRVAAPLKWHGGKTYLARRIVELMPPHLHYVEPFAGGLAVLLEKDPQGVSEVVNDANRDLTNFWSVLQRDSLYQEFIRKAQSTPFSQVEWEKAAERASMPVADAVDRALHFFVLCRQSLAGRMREFATITRNRTRRGMNEQASAWLTAVDGLPAVHERLRRVVILNQRAEQVIDGQDGPNTLFYLDPPYLHSTRKTTVEYGDYEMTEDQHRSLVSLIAQCSGKFLVSTYKNHIYDALVTEHGWNSVSFELPNNAAAGASKRRMHEYIYMNYKPAKPQSAD